MENEPEAEPQEDASSLRNVSGEKADESPKPKVSYRISLNAFIPRTRSKAVFVLVMACYGWTLSSLIGAWARAVHVANPPPAFYWAIRNDPAANVLALILFAPVIESLILVGVIELVRLAHAPQVIQVVAAALFLGELHTWPWWPHAVIVAPGFCIQAASYLYWRRSSRKVAFWVVASIHALSNCIPALSYIGYVTRHA